ncbi:MAG: FadR family transcriptional regulator [Clostridiales bacterium]|nr:FadR family transcriptional regulator [Clostridiales bacterium]
MRNLHDDKLYIQVFRELRGYIIHNNLKPGDLIPTEMELCRMLSVSRNVLREAIKAMELMGIVRSCPGRGTVVCPFSLDFIFQNVLFSTAGDSEDTILEMLNVRKKIELGYMREAFRVLSDGHIAHLREVFERFKAKHESRVADLTDDRDFHMAIFTPLNNNTLITLLDAIWQVDATFQLEEKMQFKGTTTTDHENILRALEEHNEEAFVAAMLAHFSSGKYAPGAARRS